VALAEVIHRDGEAERAMRGGGFTQARFVAAVGLEDFEHDALGRESVEAHELDESVAVVVVVDERKRMHVEEELAIAGIDDREIAQVQGATDPVEARARGTVERLEERARAKRQAFLRLGAKQRLVAVRSAMPNREDRLEVRRQRHAVETIQAATLGAHHFPGDLAEHSR